MKIYTRTGDAGTTSIVGGARLPKNDPRIEAYGTVDELNSWLGLLAADTACPQPQRQVILDAQNQLFDLGAALAGAPQEALTGADIKRLEDSIDEMDQILPPQKAFILPGGCKLAARAHIARTVCRRAERRVLSFTGTDPQWAGALAYVNRLSDWLFTFARFSNVNAEVPENFWHKNA